MCVGVPIKGESVCMGCIEERGENVGVSVSAVVVPMPESVCGCMLGSMLGRCTYLYR